MRPPISSGTVYVKDPIDVWNKEHTIGNAELAARLGSPSVFDRRGTIYAYDDFEDAPLKWYYYEYANGGTGQSGTLSNDLRTPRGSGCLKMIPPNAVDGFVNVERLFGGVAMNRLGFEITISPHNTHNRAAICADIYTGSRVISAGVSLQDRGSGGISYLQSNTPYSDASWTTFDDTHLVYNDQPYPIKFVVDVENEKYVRCMFAGTEIDMSSYTPYTADSTYCQSIDCNIYVVSKSTGNDTTYFDDFILTIEEPE